MATNNNAKMNALLRANAPATSSNPSGKPADDVGNQWFRNSVRDAQEERFVNVWVRMMQAHMKNQAWEAGDFGDSDNGNG